VAPSFIGVFFVLPESFQWHGGDGVSFFGFPIGVILSVLFEYVLLGVVVSGVAVSLIYCVVTGISPIPSSSPSRAFILGDLLGECAPDLMGAAIGELGAGWGTMAFPLSARFPGTKVLAYELSPVPWLFMWLRQGLFRRRNLRIHRRNFLKEPLSGLSLVVCYLHSECLEKLRPKMEAELAPGTLVISNTFDIPGWEPDAVHKLDDSFCPQVYVYRVPGATLNAPAPVE